MALDMDAIISMNLPSREVDLTARDTILYALGLGFGRDPLNEQELRFVYEAKLRAMPSMCNVLCSPGFWSQDPKYGIDWVKILHAEQAFTIHAPLPVSGKVRGHVHVSGIEDKGKERGALMHQIKSLTDDTSGTLLATVRQTLMLRGNGGEGSFGQAEAPAMPLPDRAPDSVVTLPTEPGLALLYRLNGDWNPLHADPAIAQKAGFDRPILQGLCTNGIAARAIVSHYCDYNPERLKSMFVRFSKPVIPGDRLVFEFFEDGSVLNFRARVPERDIVVLDRCRAELG